VSTVFDRTDHVTYTAWSMLRREDH